MEKILVVEDNKDVNLLLVEALKKEGYEVTSAFDGLQGKKEALSGKYTLLLLDIMLPYVSGDEILKIVREKSDTPILILSAKDMVTTKIDLLKLGADDYVTKPFDIAEVCTRVGVLLRRNRTVNITNQLLEYKDIRIDVNEKSVTVAGKSLDLTAKEYQIMELFLMNPNQVFSKAKLYESIWGESYIGDDNTIKTHISNLRNKLKEADEKQEYIETVWGLGYRLYKV